MSRWVRVLAVALVLVSLGLVAAGLRLLWSRDSLPEAAVLTVRLSGDLPEERSRSVLARLMGGQELTVLETVRSLAAAAGDDRIRAVRVRVSGLRCGLGRAQEIRRALAAVRSSGKPVLAAVESGGLVDYYVASAADEVFLLPGGTLLLGGMVAEVPFVRGTLDRIGIEPDFLVSGSEKDSPDVYTRSGMSEGMRRNLERILGDLQDQMLDEVAASRGLEPAEVRSLSEQGFFHAAEAQAAGLADGVLHPDELQPRMGDRLGLDLEELDLQRYAGSLAPGWLHRPPVVAVVHVSGLLVSGDSLENEWYGRAAGAETVAQALKAAREDADVEAVVLRVDSPGGGVDASELIWRAVRLTSEKKPVVVSLGDYGASGGYYLAVAGDEILAEPASLTGSIGVFSGKFALTGLYDWIGMSWDQVKIGENADMFLDRVPWTESQRRLLRDHLETVHERFIALVARGRDLPVERVRELATGRVFTGREAADLGLVDAVGGIDDAIAAAARRAGLEPAAPLRLRIYPRSRGWLGSLLSGSRASALPVGPLGEAAAAGLAYERLSGERALVWFPGRVHLP